MFKGNCFNNISEVTLLQFLPQFVWVNVVGRRLDVQPRLSAQRVPKHSQQLPVPPDTVAARHVLHEQCGQQQQWQREIEEAEAEEGEKGKQVGEVVL